MKEAVYSLESGIDLFRGRLLEHSRAFRHCAILDSFSDKGAVVPVTGVKYDLIAAFGAREMYRFEEGGFTGLDAFIDRHKGQWILGHVGYDLKNEIEKLHSRHEDPIGFGLLCFFVPQTLLVLQGSKVTVIAKDPVAEWNRIQSHSFSGSEKAPAVELHQTTGEKEYLGAVDRALHHIRSGDIYEMNFCHEFHATLPGMDIPAMAGRLFARAPGPFSCYYRMQDSHLICASPERFLQKEGSRLLSQPIKGTAARHPDPEQDKLRPVMLAADPKERSENVMIVDLVRNDLSRVAAKGSVQVDELFGVYTFPGAHQMISTVSCTLKPDVSFSAILKALFPMGSMTGAPKIRAMEIIEQLEEVRRGLFSGSVGYISPDGDFDFNVVIRNIQYNAATGYLSLMAGGAITAASNSLNEYRETLVKLQPQFRILGFNHQNIPADA